MDYFLCIIVPNSNSIREDKARTNVKMGQDRSKTLVKIKTIKAANTDNNKETINTNKITYFFSFLQFFSEYLLFHGPLSFGATTHTPSYGFFFHLNSIHAIHC